MAKVKLNPAIQQIWGALGNMVFRRGQGGKTHVTKKPNMSKVEWSEAQQKHRQRFALAIGYANSAMADERVWALYAAEAAEKGRRPFPLAVSDYFKGRNLFLEGKSEK